MALIRAMLQLLILCSICFIIDNNEDFSHVHGLSCAHSQPPCTHLPQRENIISEAQYAIKHLISILHRMKLRHQLLKWLPSNHTDSHDSIGSEDFWVQVLLHSAMHNAPLKLTCCSFHHECMHCICPSFNFLCQNVFQWHSKCHYQPIKKIFSRSHYIIFV